MVVMDRNTKDMVIPKSLGNFVTEGSGGVTPEEAAEIASAVTEEAISEYDTELQVDLEEIREAVSANTVTLLDLAEIAVMTVADRVALFDEIYDKAASGESVYIKGLVQEETIRTAILPLVSYRPETNPILHQGGYLYFAAKGDTDNIYFHIALSSEGAIDPTSSTLIKRNIYTLPTASSEVKGGVKIGSGLTMVGETLMVDTTGLVTDGDLAPFIVQLSGNTQDIGTLSGDVETNALAIANLENNVVPELQGAVSEIGGLAESANTKVEALSAVTSALTQTVAGKQDTLTAGNGIDLSGTTISVKAGEGLAFSGDTLVVSGVSSGPTNYYLNDMSQQELADLYDMLAELTEYDNDSSNIPYIFENYRFFAHTADFDGQQYVQLFFSNWEEQDGDYQLWIGGMLPTKASYPVNIHRTIAIILSDGTLGMSNSDLANIDDAANDFQIHINSNGYIDSGALDNLSSLAKFNRFVFVYQDENIQNNYCVAPLKYFYRKNETVNDEEKLMEYIGVEININGTWYKGDWHFAEYEWSEWNAPDTWTTI